VLFLLDEFGSLGRMDALGAAITTLRSFGGRVMIVVQSMAHLKEHYGAEGATNFLANCGVQLFMAPADAETPEYVSRAIGDFTRRSRSTSWRNGQMGGATLQEREEGARLIRPEDLRRLGEGAALALIQNRDPAKVRKVRYFEDCALRRLFEGQKGPWPEPRVQPTSHPPSAIAVAPLDDEPESVASGPVRAAPAAEQPAPRAAPIRDEAQAGLDRISEKQAALLARLELARRARAEAEPVH
jgi:type IV secretion system protein VirD4